MRRLVILIAAVLPSFLKLPLYRVLGMTIGRGVKVGFGTLLLCTTVELADGARIGMFCLLRAEELRLGKRASIENLVRVAVHSLQMRSQTTISGQNEISGDRGDKRSTIYMGPASWILPHCFINVLRPVRLGRNVGVGGGSYLFTHGMWLSKLDGYPVSYGPITIDNDVWLPWGCFIMPNIDIAEGTIVGACSVVTKSLPAGVLAAGVPAKIIRETSRANLGPEERAQILADVSEAVGARRGVAVRIERTPVCDTHYIGEQPVLVLHKQGGAALQSAPVLNVQYEALDENRARAVPTWSLADYKSSPYALFSEAALEWFREARSLGIRFYPVDEDFT